MSSSIIKDSAWKFAVWQWTKAVSEDVEQQQHIVDGLRRGLIEESPIDDVLNQDGLGQALKLCVHCLSLGAEKGSEKLCESAVCALSETLSVISQSQASDLKLARVAGLDIHQLAVNMEGAVYRVIEISQQLVPYLLRLLSSTHTSIEGRKRTAWCFYFIAACHPKGACLKWAAEHYTNAANSLLDLLSSISSEVKVAACHAISMCMQKDPSFRACIAQASGIPLLIKLLEDSDVLVVTATAGAINALVHKVAAYTQWVLTLQGVPTLLEVICRLPPRDKGNHLALIQVLGTLSTMAISRIDAAKTMVEEGLLEKLEKLARLCRQDEGMSEVEEAIAICFEGLLGNGFGRPDGQILTSLEKALRSKFQKQIACAIGKTTLSELANSTCKKMTEVAANLESSLVVAIKPKQPAAIRELYSHDYSKPHSELEIREVLHNLQTNLTEELRFAFVVGVSQYEHLPRVGHAIKDAKAVASALESYGFTVTCLLNPNTLCLRSTMVQFEQRVVPGSMLFVYFSGHGICTQSGSHYLLPADFELPKSSDQPFLRQSQLQSMYGSQDWTHFAPDCSSSLLEKAGNLDGFLAKLQVKCVHSIVVTDACKRCLTAEEYAEEKLKLHHQQDQHEKGKKLLSPKQKSDNPRVAKGKYKINDQEGLWHVHLILSTERRPQSDILSSAHTPHNVESTFSSSPLLPALMEEPANTLSCKAGNSEFESANNIEVVAGWSVPTHDKKKSLQMLSHLPGLTCWEGEDLQGSLVVSACISGSERQQQPPSRRATSSLFSRTLLKLIQMKDLTLIQAVRAACKLVALETSSAQCPGCKEDGSLPLDFSFTNKRSKRF